MIQKDELLKLGVNKIIGYNRKSRSDSSPEETLSKHKEMLDDFLKPLKIPYEIESEIGSSEELDHRIILPNVLDKLEKGQANAICYVEQSRLSRDVGDVKRLFKFFKLNNVIVIDLKNNRIVDFENESQSDMTFFESISDELYIRSAKRVLMRGRKLSAKKGNAMTNRMYGLQRNPKTKVMDMVPDEAKAIKIMYNMALDGYSVKKIGNHINQMGYRSIRGNEFTYKQIWKILTSEAYKGWAIWGKQNWNKLDGKWVVKNNEVDKWYIVEDAWDAIIDSETWDKVNNEMGDRSIMSKKERASTYWATGLFRCAICGRKLSIYKANNKLFVRECQKENLTTGGRACDNSSGSIEGIEDEILNFMIIEKNILEENLENGKYNSVDNEHMNLQIKKLEQEKNAISVKVNNIMDLLETGTYTIEMFNDRYAKHNEQLKIINDKIEEINYQLTEIDMSKEVEKIINNLDSAISKIPTLSSEHGSRNRFWKSHIEKIEWDRVGKKKTANIKIVLKNVPMVTDLL